MKKEVKEMVMGGTEGRRDGRKEGKREVRKEEGTYGKREVSVHVN
jgi:hypothetical protein